jgi:N-acetylglutamate synthase-like GNAT family acetyltransferase
MISRARPGLLNCGTYYVAVTEDGAIVGAGGWALDAKRLGLGHIGYVVTDDRQMRQGISSGLMVHCFDKARAAGIYRLECWSPFTAVPFYSAIGFAEIGPVDVQLLPGISFPAMQMTQLLFELFFSGVLESDLTRLFAGRMQNSPGSVILSESRYILVEYAEEQC